MCTLVFVYVVCCSPVSDNWCGFVYILSYLSKEADKMIQNFKNKISTGIDLTKSFKVMLQHGHSATTATSTRRKIKVTRVFLRLFLIAVNNDDYLVVRQSFPFNNKGLQTCELVRNEHCYLEERRTVLPNGTVIKKMKNGKYHVIS